jgi:hypothetical protein
LVASPCQLGCTGGEDACAWPAEALALVMTDPLLLSPLPRPSLEQMQCCIEGWEMMVPECFVSSHGPERRVKTWVIRWAVMEVTSKGTLS